MQPVEIKWPVVVDRLAVAPDLVGAEVSLGAHDGVNFSVLFRPEIDENLVGGAVPKHASGSVVKAVHGKAASVVYGELLVVGRLFTDMDELARVDPGHTPSAAEDEEVKRLRRLATRAADRTFSRFIDLLAVDEKRYLITVERPPLQHLGHLRVGDPPVDIPWGHDPLAITVHLSSDSIPRQNVEAAAVRVAAGEEATMPWLLLRHALRRLWLDDDPRQAVVEAATAVEVGIKTGLRRRDPSDVLALLTDTNRIKDVLLKKAAKAVFGQSYAEAEKANFDLVLALLDQRHGLVHGGSPPNRTALQKQLPAIRALLEWIDQKAP